MFVDLIIQMWNTQPGLFWSGFYFYTIKTCLWRILNIGNGDIFSLQDINSTSVLKSSNMTVNSKLGLCSVTMVSTVVWGNDRALAYVWSFSYSVLSVLCGLPPSATDKAMRKSPEGFGGKTIVSNNRAGLAIHHWWEEGNVPLMVSNLLTATLNIRIHSLHQVSGTVKAFFWRSDKLQDSLSLFLCESVLSPEAVHY